MGHTQLAVWGAVFAGGALSAVAASAGVAAWSLRFRKPVVEHEPPRDVLILAAHQDDCVIMAGEYAIEARRQGKRVQVVYLTCGAATPEEPRVAIRRLECERAWELIGVPADKLLFLNLPQSEVEGPSRLTGEHLQSARTSIEAALADLPEKAAVFIPAAGETHGDHRALRQVSLEALERVGRTDLRTLEVPEYNGWYSLWHTPWRGLSFALSGFPLLGRIVSLSGDRARAGFLHGGPPHVLSPDAARLEKKRDMLRLFVSEDGPLLVKYFGHCDWFRPVDRIKGIGKGENATGCVKIGGRSLGISVVLMLASMWALSLAVAWLAVLLIADLGGGRGDWAGGFFGAIGTAVCAAMILRNKALERRMTWIACGAGILLALLARHMVKSS
jgi:LmbE family N-acetylglucosaminyl deacetylase